MCKPDFDLTDRVAIVTGGSRGIGFAIASCYAEAGAKVVANRKAAEGEAAAAEIRGAGGEAIAIPTDVTNADSVRVMADTTVRQFGRIDIMVNNAGRAVVKTALEHRLLALFLASDASDYVTGQTIFVDGGWTAA